MKVDANGNPIAEDDDQKKDEDDQNKEPEGKGNPQDKGTDDKGSKGNENNPGDDGKNEGDDKKDDKAVDKEALKAEILAEMGLDASQVEKYKKFSSLFTGKEDEDKKTPDEKIADLERRTELAELKPI